MSDNKTKTPGELEKTHLVSSNKAYSAAKKLRIKVLGGERERSTDKNDTPEQAHSPEDNSTPATDGMAGNNNILTSISYGFLILCLLVAGYYYFGNYPSAVIDVEVKDLNTVSKQPSKHTSSSPHVSANRPIAVRDIVSNLMKDAVWDMYKIHSLKKNWVQLDTKKQIEISHAAWFKEFQTALDKQLNTPKPNALFNKQQIIARSSALTELQEILSKVIPSHTSAEVAVHTDAPSGVVDSNGVANGTDSSEASGTSVTVSPAETEANGEFPAVQINSAVAPINNEKAKKLLSAVTESKRESPENADSTLKATSEQVAILRSLYATKPIQTPSSTISATKKTTDEKKYYYVNGSVESLRNSSNQKTPTVAELNDLTVQLSNYYETGNFEGFTSLFAGDLNSENEEALSQTKKQFKDWLAGTSDRQMFIKELNWSFNKNNAVGRGELSLTLISHQEPRIVTIKKRIELTVTKEDQKVYISSFEQSEF